MRQGVVDALFEHPECRREGVDGRRAEEQSFPLENLKRGNCNANCGNVMMQLGEKEELLTLQQLLGTANCNGGGDDGDSAGHQKDGVTRRRQPPQCR